MGHGQLRLERRGGVNLWKMESKMFEQDLIPKNLVKTLLFHVKDAVMEGCSLRQGPLGLQSLQQEASMPVKSESFCPAIGSVKLNSK